MMGRSDRKTRLLTPKRNITFWPSPKDSSKYLVQKSYAIFYPRHNRWRNKSSVHKVIWPGSCSWPCRGSAWPSTFHFMSEFSQKERAESCWRENMCLSTVVTNNQTLSWALQTSISLRFPKASGRLPPSPLLEGRMLVHSKDAGNSLG